MPIVSATLITNIEVCAHFPLWKQARSNWNFNTIFRMVSIRGQLLFW